MTITNNVISQTEAEGIDIQNFAGTITNANISNNALSDTGDVATPGSADLAHRLRHADDRRPASRRATVANNTITDFRAGVGVQVRAGNANAGGPAGSAGTAGSATDVIAITGNLMNGGNGGIGNQPDRFFTGGAHGMRSGQLQRLQQRHRGEPDPQHRLHRDRAPGRRPGHDDLDGSEQLHQRQQRGRLRRHRRRHRRPAATWAPAPTRRLISGNNVMGTDGPGIFPIVRDSGSTMTARVLNNTVAAPIATNAARAGIRVDSGSAAGRHDAVPGDQRQHHRRQHEHRHRDHLAGHQPAQAGHRPGRQHLRHRGHAPPTGTPSVENYVNGLNTSTSGTFGVGGTALLSATPASPAASHPERT